MTTTPCPGCGMPRADDLADRPCPVCIAAAPDPTPPPPPAPPPPPPPEPPARPAADRRVLVVAFVLVALVAGRVGFWAGRAATPDPVVVEAPPPAPPPVRPPTPATKAAPATAPSPPPAPPKEYPKTEASKSNKLALALIPAGSFLMGSWEHEAGRLGEEVEHAVNITRPFYLGTHEVTQAEFAAVVGHNPSWFSGGGGGMGQVVTAGGTDRFPVERATWFDAVEFCNRLAAADGHPPYYRVTGAKKEGETIVAAEVEVLGGTGYRLPTEAEWEYACRAGSKGVFHFGRENTGAEANVKATVVASGYGTAERWRSAGRPRPVGSYPPNRWGLFDMHGNVAEWCGDWYDRGYYDRSPAADPPGATTGTQRVQRGGSWLVGETAARAAARVGVGPAAANSYGGFRVARTPGP